MWLFDKMSKTTPRKIDFLAANLSLDGKNGGFSRVRRIILLAIWYIWRLFVVFVG
jgi:hypothetical protein